MTDLDHEDKDFLRREYDRIKLITKLIVKTDGGMVHLGECVNLSMGGMCLGVFKETEKFNYGSLSLGYEFEGKMTQFESSFRVQWRKPSADHTDMDEIGVMFSPLTEKARRSLVQILVYQMKEQPVEADWRQ